MVIRLNLNPTMFDPYYGDRIPSIEPAWFEKLAADDWTVDPAEFNYRIQFRPAKYVKGFLAESWEFPDPTTILFHIRQGVHWQNIAPLNGREFVANDVVYHYDRILGIGGGFSKPAPAYAAVFTLGFMKTITAVDKYTVKETWGIPNIELIYESMQVVGANVDIEAKEAVDLWGDLSDWHHAIGTGPFILTDYVSDASVTLVKNQNYWGYDERYPQNKLPYIDGLKLLIIPDLSTAMSAMRTGKIDVMEGIQATQAASMTKTNPEIKQLLIPANNANTVDPRNDLAPFKDIRVREALQKAIDLPTIAKTKYNGNASPSPAPFTSQFAVGWGFPYDQWPQDLKDEYSYDPAAAKKLLSDAGYPNGFTANLVFDLSGDQDLLNIVQSQWEQIGVKLNVLSLDANSWLSYCNSGKNDGLIMRSTSAWYGSTPGIRQLTQLQPGYTTNWIMVNDPVFNGFYDQALAASTVEQQQAINKLANERAMRQHYTISLLHPNLFALYQPWLKGYNGQNQAVSGIVTPRLICFYEARFWIDTALKKSLGR
jgi:peptide/nickel transport system substrate-binding protein